MLAGASYNEIALVVFLLVLVLVAPKVGRIGDALGGLFGGGRSHGEVQGAGHRQATRSPEYRAEAPADDEPRA
ncbi:MAG: hypothetical protein IT372_11770 [Polyangiaceae bacterium]|nr:hypothetical protein [Polyangiaceae bacterium]